ncbi:MAG: stage 0 sporulation family protein [Bacilli bacterium]|nr:stage 0 sporulation family protein [Bacilli bacterium]
MAKVVGIGFKDVGKIYWFNPEEFALTFGDLVVVETIRGLEIGKVIDEVKEVPDQELEHELKSVIRIANEKDIRHYNENEVKGQEAFLKTKEIIGQHRLDMKVVNCEYTLDGAKLLIYYTADGRVDFRELLKDLASVFRVRIELRQIGQREGAKMLGGIGTCGREICCKKHLREFDLVTMKMAKDQSMALSANKITGVCGKLMCCIGYECEFYAEAKRRLPGVGDIVKTPRCQGCKVISVDYLRGLIKTEGQDGPEVWTEKEVETIVSIPKDESEDSSDGSNS